MRFAGLYIDFRNGIDAVRNRHNAVCVAAYLHGNFSRAVKFEIFKASRRAVAEVCNMLVGVAISVCAALRKVRVAALGGLEKPAVEAAALF